MNYLWNKIKIALLLGGVIMSGATAEAESTEPKRPVAIFPRAQLKYGLERGDYANKWVDRPLFVDPTLKDPKSTGHGYLSRKSFLKIREIALAYGVNGLGFFPENSPGMRAAYERVVEHPVPGFQLLTDLAPGGRHEDKIAIAGEALECPASFRINGKVVFMAYMADNRTPEHWRALMADIRKVHGDHFIFIPSLLRFAGESPSVWMRRFKDGEITPEQEEAIREWLRGWVRATDGLGTEGIANFKGWDRKLDIAFYRDFVIRHMKEVLAEPEFEHGKYLMLSAVIGHENCTRFGATLSSEGTATLRDSLEAALDAKPDLITIPEWDEQNENTSLRPTVYNSTTAMRLLRYYTAKERGKLPEPLPGDDTAAPNVILSYRKILALGEPLQLEMVFLPEKGDTEKVMLELELRDERGKTVQVFEPKEAVPGEMGVWVETVASETFSGSRYLVPVVTVKGRQEVRFDRGFQPIDLRPSWNWDYKWVMQPVRELLRPEVCKVELAPIALPGVSDGKTKPEMEFRATFRADEPLAYVEVLDNDDVVYSHQLKDKGPREDDDQVVFRVDWQSLEFQSVARKLQGSITVNGAEGQWIAPETMKVDGETLRFEGSVASVWVRRAFLVVKRAQLAEAVLEIDLPGIARQKVPLATIYDSGIYGVPGPVGFNLVVSRFVRQDKMYGHLGVKAAEFTVPVVADLPRSRFQLQAIAKSGRVFRSQPLIAGKPAGEQRAVEVYSDMKKGIVKVEVDASTLPDIDYQFSPDRTGSVLVTDAGRPFWAILGGYSTQATGRGGGESRDGTPFLRPNDYPAQIYTTRGIDTVNYDEPVDRSKSTTTRSAPDWRRLPSGEDVLVFNGRSTYVTLPQGVIPRRAGYEITMELRPEHLKGSQLLLSHRSFYPGSVKLFLEDGVLKARFVDQKVESTIVNSGLMLQPGQWHRVSFSYNQREMMFSLDGKSSGPHLVPGPGLYDTVTVVGGYGKEWFAGELKSLRIQHGRPEEQGEGSSERASSSSGSSPGRRF
ncbi:MAG TPA: LamG domain-containing protein [Chthoniobacteraceae bacterium]|nr:LamG domain-containing protein [Chthoniobacteraceae bacterium]